MTRLPKLAPADLDPAQRELYDAIAGGPRAARPQLFALTDALGLLNGPFNAMLYAPALGQALQDLGAAIRYHTSLSDRVRELAILLVAARQDSNFERYAHEPIARAAGVADDEITTVRAGQVPKLADPGEAAALRFVYALLDGDADDATYEAVVSANSNAAVVELTTLVGYYAMLALQLRVFRVETPGATS